MMYDGSNVDALAFRAYADSVKAARYRSRGGAHKVPLAELLAPYTGPILFLYGEHDVICTPETARSKLTDPQAQRECRVIPGGGHWIQHERANDVNAALAPWFAPTNA
jgi:pimeloyl-ACP methyl ester carboxylesterase